MPGDSATPLGWTNVEVQVPAVTSGALQLACSGDGLDTQPVEWSQPIAIPRSRKPGPLIVLMSLDTLRAELAALGVERDASDDLPRGDCDVYEGWLHCDSRLSPEEARAKGVGFFVRQRLREQLEALGYID